MLAPCAAGSRFRGRTRGCPADLTVPGGNTVGIELSVRAEPLGDARADRCDRSRCISRVRGGEGSDPDALGDCIVEQLLLAVTGADMGVPGVGGQAADLTEGDERDVGLLGMEEQQTLDEAIESRERILRPIGKSLGTPRPEVGHRQPVDLSEDRLFRREVVIEAGNREPGGLGDLANRGSVEAAAHEAVKGGVEQRGQERAVVGSPLCHGVILVSIRQVGPLPMAVLKQSPEAADSVRLVCCFQYQSSVPYPRCVTEDARLTKRETLVPVGDVT